MPSLRRRIVLFLVIALLGLVFFLCLLGILLLKTNVHTDTKNMMIYHGLFIEESSASKDLAAIADGGLIAAYRDINQLPSYIRQGFQWNTMDTMALYEQELTNLENEQVYVYALIYRLKEAQGHLYIVSEYRQDVEEKMQYEQSLWYESSMTMLVAGSVLIISFLFLFFLFYYMLLSPIRALSNWLSDPSQDIPYQRIKYRELVAIVQNYKQSLEKQKELVEKEELFLSTMSHELRTPIAIISSSVELLERLGVNNKVEKINQRISYAIKNMDYLAKTLLWLSRKNNQPLSNTQMNLSRLIHNVVTDNDYLVVGRDTALSVRCILEPEYEIVDNYGAVYLVLVNLIRNALQYSADGEIIIRLQDGMVTVENPFENDEQTSDEESYGYGLYLVRKICTARGFTFTNEYQSKKVVASVCFKPR